MAPRTWPGIADMRGRRATTGPCARRVVSVAAALVTVSCAVVGLAQPVSAASPAGDLAGPRVAVQSHTRSDVPGFVRFRYQTGSVSGLAPAASARADGILGTLVEKPYLAALREPADACIGGADACGYFVQRLTSTPCVAGVLCVASQVGLLPPGANGTIAYVDTRAIDTRTGGRIPLSRFVPSERRTAFVAAVNASIQRQLAAGGIVADALWSTPVTWRSVTSWLPRADGIHVWFAKYDVAPGSFGVVHVRVPWSVVA